MELESRVIPESPAHEINSLRIEMYLLMNLTAAREAKLETEWQFASGFYYRSGAKCGKKTPSNLGHPLGKGIRRNLCLPLRHYSINVSGDTKSCHHLM